MVAGRPRLGAILVDCGVISDQQLELARQHQAVHGGRLGEVLLSQGYCSDTEVARALAEQLEIPFLNLDLVTPSLECVALLPREIALEYGVLPVQMQENRLLVAARDPYDIRVDEVVRRTTGLRVTLAVAPEKQLRRLLRIHYLEDACATPESDLDCDSEDHSAEEPDQLSFKELAVAGEQISTIRAVHSLITEAVRRGASDLHFEPERDRILIRCRIDGQMCPVVTLPRPMLPSIAARIKIMCGMDISENRRPQDGGCRVTVDGQQVELRASTLRAVHGETVVLRLICHDEGLRQLDLLGIEPQTLRELHRLLAGGHGMVLSTGPTGSGKTTSLYAALNHLNRANTKILTVEDPVERQLQGIIQTQVDERAGRTYAATLRSMLRQDPNVIMVGEIRDVETADIACRAALTGQLVLSTLHTQHSIASITRLLDMGLEPWLVAACLNGVIAQRLVRRVCEECAEEYSLPRELQRVFEAQFGALEGALFRRGRGCSTCHQTGHRGRIGVYELLSIDEDLHHLLFSGAPKPELREQLQRQGFRTLEEDAFRKAFRGLIAPEEVVSLGFDVAAALEKREP